MRALLGAILILAGSILVAAGIIAHDLGSSTRGHADAGYFLGGLLTTFGFAALLAGPLKRGWDAIPVDKKKPKVDE